MHCQDTAHKHVQVFWWSALLIVSTSGISAPRTSQTYRSSGLQILAHVDVMSGAATAGHPPWQHLSGVERITSEFKRLHRSLHNGQVSQVSNMVLVDDKIAQWQLELRDFHDSIPAGRQLNEDLQQLKAQHGQDFLLMEITFPQNYPQEPPFLRVVSPRCVWYTGHVTAGGAICLEVLTNTGSANGWRSDYCAESMLQIAVVNMLNCESVIIRTASGGGRSGPLR